MRWLIPIILMFLIVQVSAQDFTPGGGDGLGNSGGGAGGDDDTPPPIMTLPPTYDYKLSLDIFGLFGDCQFNTIQKGEIKADSDTFTEIGKCVGNFFNPAIPNPLEIFDPIQRLPEKKDYILNNPLSGLETIINIVIYTPLEIVVAILNFLIKFVGRFLFTYLFYISLGYQTILSYIDNNRRLEDEDKIRATVLIIIIATIVTLSEGWLM